MDTIRIAQPTTRFERGIALAHERFDEIVRVGPWEWEVSSCSGSHTYVVNLKTRT